MLITKQNHLRNHEWSDVDNSKKLVKFLCGFVFFGVVLLFAIINAYLYLSIANLAEQLDDYKKIVESMTDDRLKTILKTHCCITVTDDKTKDVPSETLLHPDDDYYIEASGEPIYLDDEDEDKVRLLTKRSATYDDAGWTAVSQEPRPIRNFNPLKMGRVRPLPSAHFSGDTSKYVLGVHQHFHGNGRLKHMQKVYIDWKVAEWTETLGMAQYYAINNGVVTIKDTGLYFIYAQIYYVDHHDANAYRVCKNEETVLQCANYIPTVNKTEKAHSCYTAGLSFLKENDEITIRDFHNNRFSLFEPGKSFFGFIKFGDGRAGQNTLV